MKNNISNKTISVFITMIFIFGLIPSGLFAQSIPSSAAFNEVRGFNKSVFDSHFSRADRELDPERWLTEARKGITQALCAWEIIACNLYDDRLFLENAKNELVNWSNEELEDRFSQWLMGRFFGEAAEKAVFEFSTSLEKTQKNYSWRLDADGNIIFDDKSGDPSIVRPGDDGREFSLDLEKWRSEAASHVNNYGGIFNASIINMYPELLTYIPAELRENMSSIIYKTGSLISNSIKREFENIAAREERIFTNRRTMDIWSLRKKSDDEAAKIFTEKLIADTEEKCSMGIEELTIKIEQASAGAGDLALYGEEWLKLYKEQFERGLKAWEEAEERFFIRRIEWEQESFRLFSEGEETWLNAFTQFEEERQKWELKAKELFQSGEQLFKNISEEFEKNIAEAKAEFEYNMAMRTAAGTEKTAALIDMYLLSVSSAITTKGCLQFWLDQLGNPGQYSAAEIISLDNNSFADWCQEEWKNCWVKLENDYLNLPSYISSLNNLKKLEKNMNSTVFKTRFKAIKEYDIYLPEFMKENALLFTLQEINSGNITMDEENAVLDEIKNLNILDTKRFDTLSEIQETYKLYFSYFEKAADTRDKIMTDYAELLGTGALKDILDPKMSSEDFCLDEYQITLVRAKALVLYWEQKTAITEAVKNYAEELNAGRKTEAESIREWENAKALYNESLALYETELKKLNDIGADIQKKQSVLNSLALKMKEEEEKLMSLNKEYSAYIAASHNLNIDYMKKELNKKYINLVAEYRKLLISGNGALYKNAIDYGMKWYIFEQTEYADSILFMLINGDEEGTPSLKDLENGVIEGVFSKIDLISRYAAIEMFADSSNLILRPIDSTFSGADWYSRVKGIMLSADEKSSLCGEKLYSQLYADYINSSDLLLERRLSLEIEILENILDSLDEEKKLYDILTSLYERLELGKDYLTEDEEENNIILYFLSGGSFFDGLDQYLADYINNYIFCQNLLDIYSNYGRYSYFSREEDWRNTCNLLNNLFENYSVSSDEYLLPDAVLLCDEIFEREGDFAENTVQFIMEFDNCFNLIPEWLEEELSNWKNALIEYAASYALYSGKTTLLKTSLLIGEQSNISDRYNLLNNYVGSLEHIDSFEAEKINNIYSQIRYDENKLFYKYMIASAWENFEHKANNPEEEKHWRQYLNANYLANYNSLISFSASYIEGIMLDSMFNLTYRTNMINDSFLLLSGRDADINEGNNDYFYTLYANEMLRAEIQKNSLTSFYNEIKHLTNTIDILQMDFENKQKEKENVFNKMKTQEEIFNSEKNNYFNEAENFTGLGSLYDAQYSILKNSYDNITASRFEYEKQDAIKRWASTAYSEIDAADLVNCKNKLARAQTVFSVLSDIYKSEDRRAYDNPEYDALYLEYEQCFTIKLKALEAYETLSSLYLQEKNNNEYLFYQYKEAINNMGSVFQNYSKYEFSDERETWTINDIIIVKDGYLAFSHDDSWTLSGLSASGVADLNNYFFLSDNTSFKLSNYEDAICNLGQRMANYITDDKKRKNFAIAREYLLSSLIKANEDLKFLNKYYVGIGEMEKNGSWGSARVQMNKDSSVTSLYSALYNSGLTFGPNLTFTGYDNKLRNADNILENAWNSLTAQEKADLEFYVILTLNENCNDYIKGFSNVFALEIYQAAYNLVNKKYNQASDKADDEWRLITRKAWEEMRDVNKKARKNLKDSLNQTKGLIQKWVDGITKNISSISSIYQDYIDSCLTLETLSGKKETGQKIGWEDISSSLMQTNKFNMEDIDNLKNYWNKMREGRQYNYETAEKALLDIYEWSVSLEKNSRLALDKCWQNNKQEQIKKENEYYKIEEDFIAGIADINKLRNAAKAAFGENSAAWKNHYENMQKVMLNDLSLYLTCELNFLSEFDIIGKEIAMLTRQTLDNRYRMELAAREAEWDLIRRNFKNKESEWQASAAQLLERGRTDWDKSVQKLQEAYRQWGENFKIEYERVNNEWNEAYLAGLQDKENWLEQAADAANLASSNSLLSLLGTEGERLSRSFDIREPFGIRNAMPEAEALMSELLQSSGISGMTKAFNALNNSVNIIIQPVKRGMGGISVWDSALAKLAASEFARKTNAEIANKEAKILARSAHLQIDEAIESIYKNVESANKNFRESMDNTFIFKGLWRRNGNNYTKEIMKGSTLFDPVITETKTVKGYVDYRPESVSIKTNLDENNLIGLDSIAIGGLLENVYLEVKVIIDEIFGKEGETGEVINKQYGKKKLEIDEMRKQSPGKFGIHIGYEPAQKPGNKMGDSKSSMFYDMGEGELGRLIAEYIYWAVIDARGYAELSLAPWDRRMWDDSDSVLSAPSLRTAGQITCGIAAAAVSAAFTFGTSIPAIIGTMALSVGISTSSDLVFNSLDVVYGYKSFDEAGFDYAKSVTTSAVSSVVSAGFSGVGLFGNAFAQSGIAGKIAIKTAMAGAQAAATSYVGSALNAITYNSKDGFGYSKEIYQAGVNNILTNSLVAMASTFTTTSLQAINSGIDMSKLIGFNKLNKEDLQKLNGLAGALTGQGVNYAMGNDFTLNILNAGLIPGDKVQGGLLELHLGRDGTSMNFGSGGANVSLDNLAAVLRGAHVWNVNSRIGNYGEKNNFNALIALRAQYGYGDKTQKDQLWDILDGKALINTDANGNYDAKTTVDENGKRVINLTGYQSDMSVADQMLLGVVLGHEAYRDGIVTANNYLETRAATLAHTKMAVSMILEKQPLTLTDNLSNDIIAFLEAKDNINLFNSYVDKNYDSSADYWKLVVRDGIAGFEYDGELTFDLSILDIKENVSQLNEEQLMAMWKLGSNYENFTDFKAAVETFYILNKQTSSFMNILEVAPKKTADQNTLDANKVAFINALKGVDASGLLFKKDVKIDLPGEGRQIFADGSGTVNSDYGWRAVNWGADDKGKFQWHNAWDVVPLWGGSYSLLAPMDGSLFINFNNNMGVELTTSGEDNKRITYSHAKSNTLKDFISVFSNNGITLNDNGSLSGIAQNMVIGTMGNTGALSAGNHVHLTYKEGNKVLDPALFFDRVMFTNSEYSYKMSGLGNDRNNFKQLTDYQMSQIYDHLNKYNKEEADMLFLRFTLYNKPQLYFDIVQGYNKNILK